MGKHEVKINITARLSLILFGLTMISGLVLVNSSASADNPTSATASVNVSAACTLSGGNNSYTDTLANNESKTFGPSTIKAVCNDASGFVLYAIGYSGDTMTGGNNDKMLGNISGNNINTATDDNPGSGSYWAMQVNAVSGTYTPTIENSFDSASFHIVPSSFTKVATRNSATDQGASAEGASVNANYKVSIAATQPADTYTGKVKYVLMHPNTAVTGTYDINYYANGGTGTLASQTNLYNFEDQTLSAISSGTITAPTGYRFIGWCSAQESTPATSTNPQTTCPGQFYEDAGTIAASTITTDSATMNLYAIYAHYSELALINTNATTTGSTSTIATKGQSTTDTPITNPERTYTISGLTNNGVGGENAEVTFPASGPCTSTSACAYTYTFAGWYDTVSNGNPTGTKIINPDSTFTASNGYTNSEGKWHSDETPTLYAQWNNGTAITLPTITKTGYTCGWATSSSTTTRTYSSGQTDVTLTANTTLYGTCSANSYTITLNQNGATTSSSPTSVNATYNQSTLSSAITNPSKTYSASGFTMGTYASGATVTFPSTGNCTSASNCTYTNTFNGWYNTSSATGGTQIITTAGTLTPSNGWTDANANWTSTSDQTVYARWSAGTSITLPTITKTGYNCGWSENSSASTYTYQSGYSGLTLDSNKTLYGICEIKSNLSLKVSFDSHVTSVDVRYGTSTGTLVDTISTSGDSVSGLIYNADYYLIPTFASGYKFNSWTKDSGAVGTLHDDTSSTAYYTIGDGSNGVTLTSKQSCTAFPTNTYMQDFNGTINYCTTSGTLKDARDQIEYTVAKLADGKWWMTKNLNLAGGTTISCTTSDCNNYTIPTTQGWQSGGRLPASSTSGWDSANYAYVYNSKKTTCGDKKPCYSYYSWDAATLGSGRSISTDNQNARYSICPKNWKLPSTYNGSGTAAEATDFRALMIALGGSNSIQSYTSSTSPTGATMYSKLTNWGNKFLLAGYYGNGSSLLSGGSYGYYWSSTSYSSTYYARYLSLNSTSVNSANYGHRGNGASVRCVFSS